MALSANAVGLDLTNRTLRKLHHAMANDAADITTAATGDIMIMLDASDNYEPKYADAANVLELLGQQDLSGVTSTAAELNKLDDSVTILSRGAGVSEAESYAVGYLQNGSLVTTRILVDLTGLIGSATDLDIIGESAAASCHFGQVTTAKCGTLIGGSVTCLEVPAGGADDIDFYSATVSTGTQDVDVTTLTETALVTSGGAWTSGATKGMTALPTANDYLYIVNGEAAGGTFTAGKFLITLYGTA